MPAIAQLKGLEELDIGNNSIDDDSLKALTTLTHLCKLNVAGTNVTDKGLRAISALPLVDIDGPWDEASLSVTKSIVEPNKAKGMIPKNCDPMNIFSYDD